MKSTSRLFLLFSALSLVIAGCTTTSAPPANTPQDKAAGTDGKTPALPAPTCKSVDAIGKKTIPPEIYDDMRQCALTENYDKGVALFALAGAYSFYDALRMEDPLTAQVRTDLLRDSLNSLDLPHKTALNDAIMGVLDNDEKLASICKEVARAGPPSYYPAYMILQGKDGAATVKSGGGLFTPHDTKATWAAAFNGFLHCPQP